MFEIQRINYRYPDKKSAATADTEQGRMYPPHFFLAVSRYGMNKPSAIDPLP